MTANESLMAFADVRPKRCRCASAISSRSRQDVAPTGNAWHICIIRWAISETGAHRTGSATARPHRAIAGNRTPIRSNGSVNPRILPESPASSTPGAGRYRTAPRKHPAHRRPSSERRQSGDSRFDTTHLEANEFDRSFSALPDGFAVAAIRPPNSTTAHEKVEPDDKQWPGR